MPEKVWLITGSSRGFGRALAEAVLAQGDRVVATARDTAALADLAVRWPQTSLVAELDVTSPEQIKKVVQEAVAAFGKLDVLVNNAGYGLLGAVEECSDSQLRRNFEVNFFGALNLIRCVLPHFRAQKSGHVLNMSAAAAITNYPGFGVYGASKCALEGVSESLAAEGRSFGLKVTIVEPGPFRTEFISRSLETVSSSAQEYDATVGRFGKLLAGINGKQAGDPEKAAHAIIQAVEAERPPLRLVLGRYAIEKTRRKWVQGEAELKMWEDVGANTDATST